MHDFMFDESGQGFVEYGLIITLVAVIVVVALTFLGKNILPFYNDINDNMPT